MKRERVLSDVALRSKVQGLQDHVASLRSLDLSSCGAWMNSLDFATRSVKVVRMRQRNNQGHREPGAHDEAARVEVACLEAHTLIESPLSKCMLLA